MTSPCLNQSDPVDNHFDDDDAILAYSRSSFSSGYFDESAESEYISSDLYEKHYPQSDPVSLSSPCHLSSPPPSIVVRGTTLTRHDSLLDDVIGDKSRISQVGQTSTASEEGRNSSIIRKRRHGSTKDKKSRLTQLLVRNVQGTDLTKSPRYYDFKSRYGEDYRGRPLHDTVHFECKPALLSLDNPTLNLRGVLVLLCCIACSSSLKNVMANFRRYGMVVTLFPTFDYKLMNDVFKTGLAIVLMLSAASIVYALQVWLDVSTRPITKDDLRRMKMESKLTSEAKQPGFRARGFSETWTEYLTFDSELSTEKTTTEAASDQVLTRRIRSMTSEVVHENGDIDQPYNSTKKNKREGHKKRISSSENGKKQGKKREIVSAKNATATYTEPMCRMVQQRYVLVRQLGSFLMIVTLFVGGHYYVSSQFYHWLNRGFSLLCFTTIAMKTISFVHVCHDYRVAYSQGTPWSEIGGTNEDIAILLKAKDYRDIFNWYHFIRFFWMPTLTFQFTYPSARNINWVTVIVDLIFFFTWAFGIRVIKDQYIMVALNELYTSDSWKAERSIVKLSSLLLEYIFRVATPLVISWILFFLMFFHHGMNIAAELTNFGDRQFYLDWWNCRGFQDYWRKWNLPVHHFATRHVFKPLLSIGCPGPLAGLLVFAISAWAHEYLINTTWQIPYTYLVFASFVAQLPMIILLDDKFEGVAGNAMFWIIFCVTGQPIAMAFIYYIVGTTSGTLEPRSFDFTESSEAMLIIDALSRLQTLQAPEQAKLHINRHMTDLVDYLKTQFVDPGYGQGYGQGYGPLANMIAERFNL